MGVTLFLDTNNNNVLDPGEVSTTSDATGNYRFTNLVAGRYIVREAGQAGVLQTTPNPAPITLSNGQQVSGVEFGDFLLVTISGLKFDDLNGNGVRDPGDPGLAGVTLFLDSNNNNVLDPGEASTTSDAAGNYRFANLGPGTYAIREVQSPSARQTTANPAAIPATAARTSAA